MTPKIKAPRASADSGSSATPPDGTKVVTTTSDVMAAVVRVLDTLNDIGRAMLEQLEEEKNQ